MPNIDSNFPTNSTTVADVLDDVSDNPMLASLADVQVPEALKEEAPPEDLVHRHFDDSAFWRRFLPYADVTRDEFLDHKFQNKHSVQSVAQLEQLLEGVADPKFIEDVKTGLAQAPMNMRISPYLLSLSLSLRKSRSRAGERDLDLDLDLRLWYGLLWSPAPLLSSLSSASGERELNLRRDLSLPLPPASSS